MSANINANHPFNASLHTDEPIPIVGDPSLLTPERHLEAPAKTELFQPFALTLAWQAWGRFAVPPFLILNGWVFGNVVAWWFWRHLQIAPTDQLAHLWRCWFEIERALGWAICGTTAWWLAALPGRDRRYKPQLRKAWLLSWSFVWLMLALETSLRFTMNSPWMVDAAMRVKLTTMGLESGLDGLSLLVMWATRPIWAFGLVYALAWSCHRCAQSVEEAPLAPAATD